MKPIIPLLLLSLTLGTDCRADVKYVDFQKIDPSGQYASRQRFLLENLVYYDHWSPDWIYAPSKDSLIRQLKQCLAIFTPLKANPHETDLLLGEIAHYLYNLSEQSYYDTAVSWFKKAIASDEKDCRGYWFLAYHYSQSDEVVKGIEMFNTALKLATDQTGADFWQEYAFAMQVGGMPSHSLYGLDNFKKHGGTSDLSKIMDSTIRSKCRPADPDITYNSTALWEKEKNGQKIAFVSRPLGVKFSVEPDCQMQFTSFAKRLAAVSIQPPVLTGKKGNPIGFSMGIVVHAAEDGEQLNDFVASMMKLKGTRDAAFPFPDWFPGGIAYTVKDNSIYSDRGGAHIHFIGVERNYPPYPGLSLEEQALTMKGEPGKLQFMEISLIRTRIPGRVFYLFMLDTCEEIHDGSWKAFREFVHTVRLD